MGTILFVNNDHYLSTYLLSLFPHLCTSPHTCYAQHTIHNFFINLIQYQSTNMKLYFILPTAAVAAGSIFHSDQLVPNNAVRLVARKIDPNTMDPTRLSVLSVLKTAIPCGAHYPESTGDMQAWYSKLPADVKALLPSLYPVISTASPSVSAPVYRSSSATVSSPSIAKLVSYSLIPALASAPPWLYTPHLQR
jgi:hypothetical protein